MNNPFRPKVAIIILNWNGWQDTIECLGSLSCMTYANYKVVVVDNGSTDGSVEMIRQWAKGKLPVEILGLEHNIGYAKGNNAGIRHALEDNDVRFMLILNNDTIVTKDFLSPLIGIFDSYPKAGLAGPKILDHESGEQKQGPLYKRLGLWAMIMLNTPLKRSFITAPFRRRYHTQDMGLQKAYSVTGSCMLFKREILEAIGMFDENTFLGWEECIIAEKLLKQGYETYYAPESVIYHKFGYSTKKMEPVEKTIAFLLSERYFQDNFLKMPLFKRAILNSIKIISYSFIALFNGSYRKRYFQLMRAI